MTDFNALVDAFANLVADKVAERIGATTIINNNNPSNDWPPVTLETKGEGNFTATTRDDDMRRVELLKVDVRTLRKLYTSAGNDNPVGVSKPDLVEKILTWEKSNSRDIDYIPNDVDIEPEPEPADDDTPVELTRESAMELDLATLRGVARDSGYGEDDYAGMDVDLIVGLIFDGRRVEPELGPAPVETTVPDTETEVDGDDDDYYTEEDIKAMSLAELKELASDNDIEYDRNSTREDLVDLIISAF